MQAAGIELAEVTFVEHTKSGLAYPNDKHISTADNDNFEMLFNFTCPNIIISWTTCTPRKSGVGQAVDHQAHPVTSFDNF